MQRQLSEVQGEIATLSSLLSHTPDDDPNMPHLLSHLGECYEQRFDLLQDTDDIDKAIENTSIAIAMTADDDPGLPDLLGTASGACVKRFRRTGDVEDIEKAIEHGSLTLALTSDGDRDMLMRLANLGALHSERFGRLGEMKDIEKSIECFSRAVALTPTDHPNLPVRLTNLGVCHLERFKRLGEMNDLERSIEYQSRVFALVSDNDPRLPNFLANLALSHKNRFRRQGRIDDIDKAIECESRAAALTPNGHPELSTRFANLGTSHGERFDRFGVMDDLEKAIEYKSRAVSLTPEDHPNFPTYLANLGLACTHRFYRLGRLDDLERGIESESRAVALTPDGHPDLPQRLANLGSSFRERFKRLKELEDVEKAIEYGSRAVALTHSDQPHSPNDLTNLGLSHGERFEYLGVTGDLEKSIEYASRAVALTPDDHPELPLRLTNLGTALRKRFQISGDLDDLGTAIEYQSRAVALFPYGHPLFSGCLSNLGAFYGHLFEELGELDDLDKAIDYSSRAVLLIPDDHPEVPFRIANLGAFHSYRYQRLGDSHDLETAIECQSRALALTPDGHPNIPVFHYHRATTLLYHDQRTGDNCYSQNTLDSLRSAAQSLSGAPRTKFRYALDWADLASTSDSLNPIEAFQTTLDMLPQFIWLGATTDQRYEDLLRVQTLAVDAASAAIRSSDCSLALEWLEYARCVVWNQSLMLRSPLDELQSSHPDLATRLQSVAEQLRVVDSEPGGPKKPSSSMTAEQIAQEHRRLAKEYEYLLAQARTLDGFEDLLRPMKASRLVRVARHGPIVVVNCHEARCDALLILPGQNDIHHVPLPNFTGQKAHRARSEMEKSLRSKLIRERGVKPRKVSGQKDQFGSVLASLWYNVAKPVLDYLGYIDNAPTSNLPHITWCPTGALSFLPLHAAGDYNQPGSRVFEYVISSYIPTVTALLASTPSVFSPKSKVLAVGMQFTPGHTPLPGTAGEVERLKAHVEGIAQYSQLMNEQATTTAVLDAMETHDWVHLACHAHQNVNNPTSSGFFLHRGTLDLAAINRRSFTNKGLAFLSACQTATGDDLLPDEAVHLASGMLMAGYSSVIGTMWSVVDQDAPVVADKVYGQLMNGGKLGNGEAGKALHEAVAELREKIGEKEFGRWVPYIHIGS